jgi:sugar O-acyltransferase (sialic acid O-acetyltransferase NeuD family)
MKKIAIVGSGGFAREVLTLINDINKQSPIYEFIGFVDYDKSKKIHSYPIIGSDDDVNMITEPLSLVIAVGEPELKKKIRNKYTSPHIDFPTLIHPSVLIGDKNSVYIGEGCVICAGCIITTDIEINNFVTLNLMCTVGHDTIIGNYSSFMPSVNISGEVKINEGVYVGTGAKIINQIEIGGQTIVGAGAVVARTLPSRCTAVGIPAKVIKYHE